MEQEKWKSLDFLGYPNYEVSTFGRIRNSTTKCILKLGKSGDRLIYYSKILYNKGTSKQFRINRLVALAFIPNPENKPCVDHIDGDCRNNKVDNLRWTTWKENINNPITVKRRSDANIGDKNPMYRVPSPIKGKHKVNDGNGKYHFEF